MAERPAVLITGAAGGIGRALAKCWQADGARLVLVDLDRARLEATAAELGEAGAEVCAVTCDITDPEACRHAVAVALERFGRLDVLVNNAGAVHRSSFADTALDVFERVMAVNFFGALYMAKAALPALGASRGLIVVTSSIAGVAPLYGRSGYAASKHALHGLFESARTELASAGIRVLMVCPTFTRSDFEARAMGPDGRPAGTARSSTGRIAEPDEVARAIVRAAAAGRELVVLSWVGKLAFYLSRLAPRFYARRMVARLATGGTVR